MNNIPMYFGNTIPTATQPFGYPINYNMQYQSGNNQIQQMSATPVMSNKIVVDSIEDVKNYYVAPGGDFMFLHRTQPILFRKAVDTKGTVTLETYDISKHENEEPYVSKQEFRSLQNDINELKQLLKPNTQAGGENESTVK